MTLKYVGPKFLASPTGIDFNTSKEDKYVYIGVMVELIKVLDHDYQDNKIYSTQTQQKSYDEKSIINLIRTYITDIDEQIKQWSDKAIEGINIEICRASNCFRLNYEEQESLIKNIEIMRPYKIQRTINKAIYYAGIDALANIIKQRHIDYITTSIEPKHLHVLHSIQGSLRRFHPAIDSEINILRKQGHLLIELKILN